MIPYVGGYVKFMKEGWFELSADGTYEDNMKYEYGKIIKVSKNKINDIMMYSFSIEMMDKEGNKYTRISLPDEFEFITEDEMMVEEL